MTNKASKNMPVVTTCCWSLDHRNRFANHQPTDSGQRSIDQQRQPNIHTKQRLFSEYIGRIWIVDCYHHNRCEKLIQHVLNNFESTEVGFVSHARHQNEI